MATQKSRATDLGLLLLRLGAGLMLLGFHGWGKLTAAVGYHLYGAEWRFVGGVESMGFPAPALFATLAALAESLGGLLLAAGLWTRYTAAIVLFNMSVAAYRHIVGDFRFELAGMYWIAALVILLIGPGAFSIDARLGRRGRR